MHSVYPFLAICSARLDLLAFTIITILDDLYKCKVSRYVIPRIVHFLRLS